MLNKIIENIKNLNIIGLKETEKFIGKILELENKERRLFLKEIDLETAKRIMYCIPKLTDTLGLLDGRSYEERVKCRYEHINHNPDKCYWDYVEYQNYGEEVLERSDDVLISTTGVIIRIDKVYKVLTINNIPSINNGRYLLFKGLPRNVDYSIHRAVVSTFVPKPDRHIDLPYSQLVTNHKDKDIYNNHISNLEWVTHFENNRHGRGDTEYTKEPYFLFEVAIDNNYEGMKFIALSKEIGDGIEYSSVIKAMTRGYAVKGLIAKFPSNDDFENYRIGVPLELQEMLNKDDTYLKVQTKVVIGTVLQGINTGLEFALFGKKEKKKWFSSSAIDYVINGRCKIHKGCTFRKATRREADKLRGIMTDEIFNTIIVSQTENINSKE